MKAATARQVALVSLTVTATALFTDARCPPPCNGLLMLVPGETDVEVRPTDGGPDQASGEHRVVVCRRCRSYCEVVEHG